MSEAWATGAAAPPPGKNCVVVDSVESSVDSVESSVDSAFPWIASSSFADAFADPVADPLSWSWD